MFDEFMNVTMISNPRLFCVLVALLLAHVWFQMVGFNIAKISDLQRARFGVLSVNRPLIRLLLLLGVLFSSGLAAAVYCIAITMAFTLAFFIPARIQAYSLIMRYVGRSLEDL